MEDTSKRGPGRPRKDTFDPPMHKIHLLRDYWMPHRIRAGSTVEVSAKEAMRLIQAGVAMTSNG